MICVIIDRGKEVLPLLELEMQGLGSLGTTKREDLGLQVSKEFNYSKFDKKI